MKKIMLMAFFLLSGCAKMIYNDDLILAQKYCKDKSGIDYIYQSGVEDFTVVCTNGDSIIFNDDVRKVFKDEI